MFYYRRIMSTRALVAGALATALLAAPGTANSAGDPYGPQIPVNPYAGPPGTATMHGDTGASDTTPYPAPGADTVTVTPLPLGAACPTVLIGSDGFPVALCTRISDRTPVVFLLDPGTGRPLAQHELAAGSLLGGVYGYLDDADRMVVVDGTDTLLRIAHRRTASGAWELVVNESTWLPLPDSESVTSLAPDYQGNVWFATGGSTVGVAAPAPGDVRLLSLPDGEKVANSIATAPAGVAVATTHALYLIRLTSQGEPRISWQAGYDRGSARKPGQLSWGTGSTPTFFGPRRGDDYVTIVDNADERVNLLVFRARTGEPICRIPVLTTDGPGSENSPIGAGRTVIVAGTYGYPYPAYPEDAGESDPPAADFVGGMTRVDVNPDGDVCAVVWDRPVRSAAVPKLSTADGTITTVTRDRPDGQAGTTPLDNFAYTILDAGTGEVVAQHPAAVGAGFDTLQMAGNTTADGVLYQGTISGILRIAG